MAVLHSISNQIQVNYNNYINDFNQKNQEIMMNEYSDDIDKFM